MGAGMVILMLAIGLVIGAVLCYLSLNLLFRSKVDKWKMDAEQAKKNADEIIKQAHLDAQSIVLEGRKEVDGQKNELLKEFKEREKRLNRREEQTSKRDENILQKEKEMKDVERRIKNHEALIVSRNADLDKKELEIKTELEKIAGLTHEEAKDILVHKIEDEAKHFAAKRLKVIEENLTEDSERKSKEIISTAIQRYAGEYATEHTVTTVMLPNDEMKGRIIGREGRNIRAIEAVTGVDLVIDDTPEAVVISDFNPVRREIARLTLEKLVNDGRIHPGRIEDVFNNASKEVWKTIKEAGEQALFDLGIHKMNPELVLLIGRLKYRTSYGQNVWKHSMETAFIAGEIASELGVSVKNARRAGLLHDIGKAVDHEVEGSHASIGMKLAEKYGETKKIAHAVGAHHNEIVHETVLDHIISAADAISGARPGARREMMESYVQRLTELENVATSFDGVDKAFAIQAGRELRVIVDTARVKDQDAYVLATDIAKKVEEELTYPGQIKVVLIRETRVIATAQ